MNTTTPLPLAGKSALVGRAQPLAISGSSTTDLGAWNQDHV
jgi:hypothetical protein